MSLRYRSMHYQRGNIPPMGDIMSRLFGKRSAATPNSMSSTAPTVDLAKFKFHPETGKPGTFNDKGEFQEETTGPKPGSKDAVLAQFTKLWDTPTLKDGAPTAPTFKLDKDMFKTLVDGQDFAAGIPPELLQKLKDGDHSALPEILNHSGRATYQRMFEHMGPMMEAFVTARSQYDRSGLGRSVKSELTKASLDKLAGKNPVIKRQLEVIGEQLQGQFPDASPEDIAEMVPQYFKAVASELFPDNFKEQKDPKDPNVSSSDGITSDPFDWGSWMQGQGGKPAAKEGQQ